MKKLLPLFGILLSMLSYGQIPTANLLGDFKFDKGSITNTLGSNHFAQTGTALTMIPNRAGGADRAISLNGDHLQQTFATGNSVSVSFWIKTTTEDVSKRVIIDQSERASETEGATETGWYAYLKDGKIGMAANFQWHHWNSTAAGASGYIAWHNVNAPTLIADGNWHHVTLTIDAYAGNWYNAPYQRTDGVIRNTYKIYIDNALIITQEATRNVGNATHPTMRRFLSAATPVTIANNKSGNSTNRYLEAIDDMRYYNATLVAGEVTALATETACAGSTGVTASAKDITVQLNANGSATIAAGDVNNGSVTTCGDPAIVSVDVTSFTCTNLGSNTVTLTAEDGEGHSDTAIATVTVVQLLTVSTINTTLIVPLDAAGNATLSPSDIDNGTTSSCGTVGLTMSLDKTNFSCNEVGINTVVTLTVTDAFGHSETGTATVRAEDSLVPTAIARAISVQLDAATGVATITPAMVDNGSTDNCAITLSLSKTRFTCSDVGNNEVTLTAQDNRSNWATATAIVTVTSAILDETVSALNASFCTDGSSGTLISTGSSVVGANYYLRNSANNTIVDGPIAGTGTGLDFTTGNLSATTVFNVFADMPSPKAIENSLDFDGVNDKVITPYTLSTTNTLTVEAWIYPRSSNYDRLISNYRGGSAVQAGEFLLDTYNSTDNGRNLRFVVSGTGGITQTTLSGANVLTLNAWNHVAVTFDNGVVKLFVGGTEVGTSTASFTSIPASAFEIHLGEDRIPGVAEYYNGKMDEVRIWSVARTAAQLTANKNRCLNGTETGLDLYYTFDEVTGGTVPDLANNSTGTLSNMDPASDWVSGASISCALGCGIQMSTQVTVGDIVNPTATAQNITIQLDATGNASLTATDVNNGSNDTCTPGGNLVLSLDKSSFSCSELGPNTVTLTVADAAGNQATATATVTVEDNLAPTAITKDIIVDLGANGNATITAADVNNGSTDNCTVGANLILSIDVNSFTASQLGSNTVTLTVEDAQGNSSTATATVTVNTKISQTITFGAPSDKTYTDGNFNLNATASSGLPVSYSIVSGPATLEGTIVSIAGVGIVTIEATQAGDLDYAAAPAVQRSFTISKALLTVTAANKTITYGDAMPALTFAYSGFANGETASVLTSPSTITTTATANSDAGIYPITLNAGSADNYAFALINGTLTIDKANQTISIGAIANKTIFDNAFNIVASTTSALPLSYSISGPAALSGTTITLNGTAGTVTLTASEAGSINFNQASKSISFEVIDPRQAQTISFTAIANQILELGSMSLTASATSGLAITFELVSGPATITGSIVSFSGLGKVVVKARQAGNNSFHAANPVEQSFDVVTITGFEATVAGFRIYPNPATDYLQIEIPSNVTARVSLLSLDGKEMINLTNSTERVDISTLTKGTYLVRISTTDKVTMQKIIKN